MKKLLSLVCILSAIACQPAQARDYYRKYEPVGHDTPEYVDINGARYARVPQERQQRYEQPRFARLNQEQSDDIKLKREVIQINSLNVHPYLGIDGALGKGKYKKEDDEFLFGETMKRFGVFGGLQFNQYVSLEGFYTSGSMEEKTRRAAITEFAEAKITDNIDFSAYGFDLMGYLPIQRNLDIILGLGYGWYDFDAEAKFNLYNSSIDASYAGKLKGSAKDEAIRFSLGAQFWFNESWAVRLLGRYMDFSDGKVLENMMEFSLGLRYMF